MSLVANELAIKKMRELGWPEESVESYKKFGAPIAILYPFLEARVQTPEGPGVLKQAIGFAAAVVLDSEVDRAARTKPVEKPAPGKGQDPGMSWFHWRAIKPLERVQRSTGTLPLDNGRRPRRRRNKAAGGDVTPLFPGSGV